MKALDPLIDTIACDAFEGLIPEATVRRALPEDKDPISGDELVAVIGFSGDEARGVVGLLAHPGIIRALHPTEQAGHPTSEDELADWTGELANQLLGRLKLRMMRHNIKLWMATPVVLRGVSVHVASTRQDIRKLRFDTPAGVFWAWLDLVLTDGISLAPEAAEHHHAGEMIFF